MLPERVPHLSSLISCPKALCFLWMVAWVLVPEISSARQSAGQSAGQSARQNSDTLFIDMLSEKANAIMLSNVDSGFFYANRIAEFGNTYNNDYARARGFEKLGWCYWVKGNYSEGLKNALDAIRLFERYGPSKGLTTSLLAAGRNLFEQRSYQMALTYYSRAENIARDLNFEDVLIEAYRDIGGICIFTGENDKGLEYCKKGIELSNKIGSRTAIPVFYSHMAVMYFNMGDMEMSADYNWRAILEGRLVGNRRVVALCFERLANVDLQAGNYDEAIRKGLETLEMGTELGSSLINMRAHMVLSKAYEGKRQFEKALQFHKAYTQISDSTYNADKESIIASMEAVYNLESKQKEIELLEAERALNEQVSRAKNYYILLSTVVIALLAALTIALIRASAIQTRHNTELEQKNEKIEAQAEKLAQMNATKSKIFSIIGHDLRTSVANLKNLLDLLNTKKITLKELNSVVPEAKQSVDASFDVLDNLLHWGLAQMDGIRTNIQACYISPVVAEIREHFSIPLERKAIKLVDLVSPKMKVMADLSQLTVVLRNLIGNAIKFTPEKGKITIEAIESGGHVILSITDSGVGITEEKLQLLFKSETHFSERGTNNEKGTGLGLLVCHEFVENMESQLEVQSLPGNGTSFFFKLKKA